VTAPNAELLRHMQWWILKMAGEEMAYGDTELPAAPPLSVADARQVYWWLCDCAAHVAPPLDVPIHFQGDV
jgi:hypothetical protein